MAVPLRTIGSIRAGHDRLARASRRAFPPSSARRSASVSSFSLYRVEAPESHLQPALDHAVGRVLAHDPSGYLPGRLLPAAPSHLQVAYYASRCFWIETGLRHHDHHSDGIQRSPMSAEQMLEKVEEWQRGVDAVVFGSGGAPDTASFAEHPTLTLLRHVAQQHGQRMSPSEEEEGRLRSHLHTILDARRTDLQVKQYETMDDLIRHCQRSCAPLLQLLLDVGGMHASRYPDSHRAALWVGTAHGLSNALRTSIPVVSATGKLIIPADLCVRHGVRSPRYLLSALGQGDATCVTALQRAVQDIVGEARSHLRRARELRERIGREEEEGGSGSSGAANGSAAAPVVARVLLPGLASETFLNRLEAKAFLLTDRSLRQVGHVEHLMCALGVVRAAYQGRY
jgi:phytoene/squalene synthetase